MRLLLALLLFGCGRGIVDPAPEWMEDPPDTAPKQETPSGDPERRCPDAPAGEAGACTVSEGAPGRFLIHADVAAPGELMRDGQVLIEDGTITCVDCRCEAIGATRLDCPGVIVTPGLINSHDHITWANTTPKAHDNIRYNHRHDWRKGIRGYTAVDTGQASSAKESVALGELRFVLSGGTSTVGSGGASGFLRNLDRASLLEGLPEKAVAYDTFPLGSDPVLLTDSCNYDFSPGPKPGVVGYPHVAEGVDAEAHNEFRCLTSPQGRDRLNADSAIIHGVALTLEDAMLMANRRISLIWSPRTNIDLYGYTADVVTMARFGVNIALGTDWLPSGSMNLSRELACVDGYNRAYLHGWFSDGELVRMLTENASVAAHMPSLGVLAPGRVADLALFRPTRGSGYRAVLESNPSSVTLVMRSGKVLYGDDALVAALEDNCDTLDVCGVPKRVCAVRETGLALGQLRAAAGHEYPLFSCGVPQAEPSCIPLRAQPVDKALFDGLRTASDLDGDGVADGDDNCPDMFNAPRPMDVAGGKPVQPDYDADGQGDMCDVCPLDADSDACLN